MAFDIERLKKARSGMRAVQWEGWRMHEYAKSDRWYPNSRDPHEGMFRTLFRDYGKVPRSDDEIRACIEEAERLNDRIHALFHAQQEREMMEGEEKHDLDLSSRHMALYGSLHMGHVIRGLQGAIGASTVRKGHWYTLQRREERERLKQEAADLRAFVDGPLSELR